MPSFRASGPAYLLDTSVPISQQRAATDFSRDRLSTLYHYMCKLEISRRLADTAERQRALKVKLPPSSSRPSKAPTSRGVPITVRARGVGIVGAIYSIRRKFSRVTRRPSKVTRNKRQEEPPLPPLSSPFRFHLLASALACGHTPTQRTVVNQKARLSRKFSSRSETGERKESSEGAARRTMPRGRGERGERTLLRAEEGAARRGSEDGSDVPAG